MSSLVALSIGRLARFTAAIVAASLATSLAGTAAWADTTAGLVGYWALDDDPSSTLAADSSGSGNNGTLYNGPLWTSGKLGGGLSFDGVNDRVDITPFTPPTQGTLAFWIYPTSNKAGQRILGAHDAFELRLNGDLRLSNELFAAGANVLTSISPLHLNQWTHLAFTWNYSTHRLETYINGVLDSAGALANYNPAGPLTLSLGTRSQLTPFFKGKLDDLHLYNRVLGQPDIQTLYTGVVDTTPPTVAITAPQNGDGLINTVVVSAAATDDVAMGNVRFQLDGADVGVAAAPPYNVSWNTLVGADGPHVLTAIATDLSGNSTTSDPVSVEVDNDPDVTPPSVPVITAVGTSSPYQASVSWQASTDNAAVANYHVWRDGSLIATTSARTYADGGRYAATSYGYQVSAIDIYGNESALSDPATVTTLAALPAVFPGTAWATTSPEMVGFDRSKLDQLKAASGSQIGVIVKDGYLVYSWGNTATKFDWGSAAKPVLSTMLFFAINEGRVASPDSLVRDWGWNLSAKDQPMTFRELADMTSGYALPEAPGTRWAYNDYGIQLYALTLFNRVFTDGTADAAARNPNRLGALQLQDGSLFGPVRGALGLYTSVRDYARVGWLWLNKGSWNGTPLLPSSLFDSYMVNADVPANLPRTAGGQNDYLQIGTYGGATNQSAFGPGVYGFNWWHNTAGAFWPDAPADTFQANGHANGEVVTVIPSLHIVAAWKSTAGDSNTFPQAMDNLLKILVGAVTAPPPSP